MFRKASGRTQIILAASSAVWTVFWMFYADPALASFDPRLTQDVGLGHRHGTASTTLAGVTFFGPAYLFAKTNRNLPVEPGDRAAEPEGPTEDEGDDEWLDPEPSSSSPLGRR